MMMVLRMMISFVRSIDRSRDSKNVERRLSVSDVERKAPRKLTIPQGLFGWTSKRNSLWRREGR